MTGFKRYYFATVLGKPVQVARDGMTRAKEVELGVDRVDRWALVWGRNVREARAYFLDGNVCLWYSSSKT